jgi:GWxTD domain-containing protein
MLFFAAIHAGSDKQQTLESRLELMSFDIVYDVSSLQYLLTPDEYEDFLALGSDRERRRWIDNFWRSRDPILTTPENEMRIEHERRVAFADSLFFWPDWPGWDERGEVFIRYGEPVFRHIIVPTVDETSHSPVVPPGELWFYSEHHMFVLFEDAFHNGRYSYYLERIEAPAGVRTHGISQPIDALLAGVAGRLPAGFDLESIYRQDGFQKMINNFQAVLETTPASYPFTQRLNRLPVYYDIGDFRGGVGVNRVEVHIQFVANVGEAHSASSVKRYEATAVLWDTDHNEAGRTQQVIGLPVALGFADSIRLMPAQLAFSVPPAFYEMAVTVEELDSGDFASYSARVNCRDYDSTFEISDLLFACKIAPATAPSHFNRGALQVVPHPVRRYNSTMNIPVYFELYNLDVDDTDHSDYTVEYRIVSKTPRDRGFWGWLTRKKTTIEVASSFRASSTGPHDSIHISVGAENLWVGKYSLIVKVRDNISYKEESREAVFRIVD